MKIGIISDIHSNLYGLRSVLNQLEDVADIVLCAGDLTGYYTFVNEIFDELESYGSNIKFIIGNHDYYLFQKDITNLNPIIKHSIEYTKNKISKKNLSILKNRKSHHALVIDDLNIKIYHGSPWDELEEYIYPDHNNFKKFKNIKADIVILGHTHYPMIKRIENTLILNPGSCGQPRDGDTRAAFGIFNTKNKEFIVKRTKYDIDKVCEKAIEEGFNRKLIEILRKPKFYV